MATRHDDKLITLLTKKSAKWTRAMDATTEDASKYMTAVFEDFQKAKRLKLLAFLDTLSLDENGRIVNVAANEMRLAGFIQELQTLQIETFDPESSFGKWIDRQYGKAANTGVKKAGDFYKIGEGVKTLPTGYAPPTAELIRGVKEMLFLQIADRNSMDLDLIRQSVMRRILDPTGTVQSLRQDLLKTGQLEDMLDSAGRRITASERADRIASYEFADLTTKAEQQTVNEIYNDGEEDPEGTFYLWHQVQDDRKSESHAKRHGKIMSQSAWETKDFGDGQYGLAPTRPRCRCDNILVRPEWFSPEVREKLLAGGVVTEAQMAA